MWIAYILIPISLFSLFLIIADRLAPKQKIHVDGEVIKVNFPIGCFLIICSIALFVALGVLSVVMVISGILEFIIVLAIAILVTIAFVFGLAGQAKNSILMVSDYIVVYRLFRKKTVCHFSDIACFVDNSYLGDDNELVCYGVNEEVLFSLKGRQKGIAVIRRMLWERKVPEKK